MADRPAGGEGRESDSEIEVSPEMIDAGVSELLTYSIADLDRDELRDAIRGVFRVFLSYQERGSSKEQGALIAAP